MKLEPNYLRIYRDVFEYSPISLGAKGLLAFLIFNDLKRELDFEMLKECSKENESELKALIDELSCEGYLVE